MRNHSTVHRDILRNAFTALRTEPRSDTPPPSPTHPTRRAHAAAGTAIHWRQTHGSAPNPQQAGCFSHAKWAYVDNNDPLSTNRSRDRSRCARFGPERPRATIHRTPTRTATVTLHSGVDMLTALRPSANTQVNGNRRTAGPRATDPTGPRRPNGVAFGHARQRDGRITSSGTMDRNRIGAHTKSNEAAGRGPIRPMGPPLQALAHRPIEGPRKIEIKTYVI